MKDEIKEILISLSSQYKSATGCENSYFKVKHIQQLLDYITTLQEDLKVACEVIERLKSDKKKAIEIMKKAIKEIEGEK